MRVKYVIRYENDVRSTMYVQYKYSVVTEYVSYDTYIVGKK